MAERMRVAAVIERDGHVLMVRERVQSAPGQHDGPEYWTLPGGGIEPGEDPQDAIVREVLEEVGLKVLAAREVAEVDYPSGRTTVFRVDVPSDEPRLGEDNLPCPCPRMVGLDWVPAPAMASSHGGSPVPLLIYCW
jgi:8-oxo-dGTP diphosphatase